MPAVLNATSITRSVSTSQPESTAQSVAGDPRLSNCVDRTPALDDGERHQAEEQERQRCPAQEHLPRPVEHGRQYDRRTTFRNEASRCTAPAHGRCGRPRVDQPRPGFTTPELRGEHDRLQPIAEPKLGEQMADVGLDRCLGEVQLGSQLTVRQTPGQVLQDEALPVCERRQSVRRWQHQPMPRSAAACRTCPRFRTPAKCTQKAPSTAPSAE